VVKVPRAQTQRAAQQDPGWRILYYSGTLYLFHGYHFKMALKHVKAKNGKLKKGIIIFFNFVAIKKNYYLLIIVKLKVHQ
jgi:hypothetical protein